MFKRKGSEILPNLYESLQFVLLNFGIDIFDSLEIMRFSATYPFQ